MDAVGTAPSGLTVTQIARRCRLTCHRLPLVRTLTYEGYLMPRRRTYILSLEVADRFRELRRSRSRRTPSCARSPSRPATATISAGSPVADRGCHRRRRHRSPRTPLICGGDAPDHATALGKVCSTPSVGPTGPVPAQMGMPALTGHDRHPRGLDVDLERAGNAVSRYRWWETSNRPDARAGT